MVTLFGWDSFLFAGLQIARGLRLVTLVDNIGNSINGLQIARGLRLVTLHRIDASHAWLLQIARGLRLVTLVGSKYPLSAAVADCSRTEVGYTPAPQLLIRLPVADCSRTEVGYTHAIRTVS